MVAATPRRDSIGEVLRIVHIEKDPESTPDSLRYNILDAGRYGEKSGAAEAVRSLSRQEVGDWLSKEGLSYSVVERVLGELDQKGSAHLQLTPRVGPRIVRAWFVTVWNPLIQSLEMELVLIGKRNWTFSFRPPMLELIRPVRRYLDDSGSTNLEQIEQLNVVLSLFLEAHDNAIGRLFDGALALHEALVTSAEFVKVCDSLLTPERLRELGCGDLGQVFGTFFPESDRYKLLAQFVVNNLGELPPHYAAAKFWERNREALMNCLDLPGVREHHASTLQAGSRLADASQKLLIQLKDLRLNLSVLHDVPFAPGRSGRAAD